jgi:SNF2 family DNA or RNA helicase
MDEGKLKALLGDLGGLLRPYQLEGVRWLERLTRMKAGGLLADEMGLGKTVQTVALLRILMARQTKKTKAPALVICPTSLLSNWSEEAQRFAPELNTHISHDADRKEKFAHLTDFDVIFTSYALIVRDIIHYSQINFSAIVLDEASYIRNPDTESAKAVCSLKADVRFALTGTPVENSVKDLWSIYAFSLPRYLPIMDDFKTRFVKPLSQGNSQQSRLVMERLRRLIQPYLMRRTKKEVAKDLPEKIEKVVWCDLSKAQNEVYHRILAEGREEIRQARKRTGQGSARMTMFTVLLRLRQTCNDLKLLGITTPKKEVEGGKWPVLEELLNEIIEGGGKALIFSQFVGMLRMVRDKVESMNVAYSYIDGATKDRGAQVTAFQTEPSRRLFLISLKAGGYGLNLTAADNVLLVDPWWNPAVEAQAIDRAHRIGQDRPVTAYRMITRGTVEEKILKLQAQKRAIMDMAMDDDSLLMSGISDTELEEMLL